MDKPKVQKVEALLASLEKNLKEQKNTGDKFHFLKQVLEELIDIVLVYWKAGEQKMSKDLLDIIHKEKVAFLMPNRIHQKQVICGKEWNPLQIGGYDDLEEHCTREQFLYHLKNAMENNQWDLVYPNEGKKTLQLRMWTQVVGLSCTREQFLDKLENKRKYALTNLVYTDTDINVAPLVRKWAQIKIDCTKEQLVERIKGALEDYQRSLKYLLRTWTNKEFTSFVVVFTMDKLQKFIRQIAEEYLEDETLEDEKYKNTSVKTEL